MSYEESTLRRRYTRMRSAKNFFLSPGPPRVSGTVFVHRSSAPVYFIFGSSCAPDAPLASCMVLKTLDAQERSMKIPAKFVKKKETLSVGHRERQK